MDSNDENDGIKRCFNYRFNFGGKCKHNRQSKLFCSFFIMKNENKFGQSWAAEGVAGAPWILKFDIFLLTFQKKNVVL